MNNIPNKIVIAGGSGFIGNYLSERFVAKGFQVIHISRQQGKGVLWNDEANIISALENAELLINLAGKSVNCRYKQQNKEEILFSRTSTTAILGNAVMRCKKPPKLWINSGTATIYRHAEDRPMTEIDGEIGNGFSVEVAKAWEASFFQFSRPETRQVVLRIAIVLGKKGGALVPMMRLVRAGLGGKQGSGKQMFSWIHVEDLFRIIQFIQADTSLSGIFNCSAPEPVTNEELMQLLRESLRIPLGLPSPNWLLHLGASFINTETELVLKSRWVLPDRLMKAGYFFEYSTLMDALQNILAESASIEMR
jgi:hypothetical protein